MVSTTHTIRLGRQGRLVIPAEMRRSLALHEGDSLITWVEDGEIRLATRAAAIQEAQRIVRERLRPGADTSIDAFIAERRREATLENQ